MTGSSLTRSTFARHLNTTFRLRKDALAAVDLELVEVADLEHATGASETCFSLSFKGPAREPLHQQTYTFEHPAMGRFAMFIVPVQRDGRATSYHAIFNGAAHA